MRFRLCLVLVLAACGAKPLEDRSIAFAGGHTEDVVIAPGAQRFILDGTCPSARCDLIDVSLVFGGREHPPVKLSAGASINGGECVEALLPDIPASTCTLRIFAEAHERVVTVVNHGPRRTAQLSLTLFSNPR